jgi:hypothetical protein
MDPLEEGVHCEFVAAILADNFNLLSASTISSSNIFSEWITSIIIAIEINNKLAVDVAGAIIASVSISIDNS